MMVIPQDLEKRLQLLVSFPVNVKDSRSACSICSGVLWAVSGPRISCRTASLSVPAEVTSLAVHHQDPY